MKEKLLCIMFLLPVFLTVGAGKTKLPNAYHLRKTLDALMLVELETMQEIIVLLLADKELEIPEIEDIVIDVIERNASKPYSPICRTVIEERVQLWIENVIKRGK